MRKDKLTPVQKKCYNKAITSLQNAYHYLCNANGPLPSPEQQCIVADMLSKFQKAIDKL